MNNKMYICYLRRVRASALQLMALDLVDHCRRTWKVITSFDIRQKPRHANGQPSAICWIVAAPNTLQSYYHFSDAFLDFWWHLKSLRFLTLRPMCAHRDFRPARCNLCAIRAIKRQEMPYKMVTDWIYGVFVQWPLEQRQHGQPPQTAA